MGKVIDWEKMTKSHVNLSKEPRAKKIEKGQTKQKKTICIQRIRRVKHTEQIYATR